MSIRTIVLADDHVLIRQGLKKIIDADPTLRVMGEVGDGLELLAYLKKHNPDLILLDISMPNLRGIEAIHEAKKIRPGVKILILTMHSGKDYLCAAMEAGADGYLLKEDSDTELLTAIERCLDDELYISPVLSQVVSGGRVLNFCPERGSSGEDLTVREKQVLNMVAEGKKSRDIAELLSISIRTVEHHRANIMRKTKIKNTADLIKYAIQKGFISSPR